MWNPKYSSVAMSYVSVAWERSEGELRQTVDIMVWNDGTMDVYAEQSWKGSSKGYRLTNFPRCYIFGQDEITSLFYEALTKGEN